MSCSRYRQLISRYVDNEATPRQREELLAHVQTCHDCAAWLARARQTDVLLRGINETRPSDRVRSAILDQVRAHNTEQAPTPRTAAPLPTKHRHPSPGLSALRLVASSLLLRFDPSPYRVALAFVATVIGLFGLAYWLNIIQISEAVLCGKASQYSPAIPAKKGVAIEVPEMVLCFFPFQLL